MTAFITALTATATLTNEELPALIEEQLRAQGLLAGISFSHDYVDGDEGNESDEGNEANEGDEDNEGDEFDEGNENDEGNEDD
ncbi:hypothetical protein KL867_17575, partial [Ruegeria litorea]